MTILLLLIQGHEVLHFRSRPEHQALSGLGRTPIPKLGVIQVIPCVVVGKNVPSVIDIPIRYYFFRDFFFIILIEVVELI